jgi:hypothetical protein
VKVLVTGWFSFEHGEATAGDLLARDVACEWLDQAGRSYDVALSPAFGNGVDWQEADPANYSEVVFVCGPAKGWQIEGLVERFSGCRLIGLDVSVLDEDHPFDFLLERDSFATTHPDISFLAETESLPVVGLILAHPQPEYGQRTAHEAAHVTIRDVLHARRISVVPFDTRVDPRLEGFPGAFGAPAEVESLVARMDLVVTTRMHGMVHALKSGVPAVAVDPITGGAKVRRQAEAVGWPAVLSADELSEAALHEALDYCLTPEATITARSCAERAAKLLQPVREGFIEALGSGHQWMP